VGNSSDLRSDLRSSCSPKGLFSDVPHWVAQGRQAEAHCCSADKGRENGPSRPPAVTLRQAVYLPPGLSNPMKVAHDAAIYRMFHKEAGLIEADGGTIKRVVLDYELKRKVYSPLAKARGAAPP